MLQAARSKYVGPYTLAIVSGQYTRASALSLQRGKAAFGMEPTAFTGLMASTFIAYGSVAELARVFGADVQAKLCDFPRKLLGVYCNKNFIWLTWEGVEAVPAVCDQAIRLAAEIAGIKL
jgi:hypothetical protein